MASIYQSFLRSPNVSLLAPNASLHYITTTTTITQPDAIVKHLEVQSRQVEKKEEKVLSCIEASNGICLETETTYVFKKGGGVILPQMDENMLADTTAICPVVHVVTLDDSGKIAQIRLHWDQGTVLKQVEAIGKTGRNWPIRDGKAQTKVILESVNTTGQASAGAQRNGQSDNHRTASGRIADDYTKRLFATGDEDELRPTARSSSGVVPRQSAKPQPRQWGELFSGEEEAEVASTVGSPNIRSPHLPVLKAGAGKNFKPNRLFDEEPEDSRSRSPERKKVDPNKYEHFEFGNGEDATQKQGLGIHGKKQMSNWDFKDFTTPVKYVQRANPEQERHFGYGIDEDDQPSPPKRDLKHMPRPDAKTNFDMSDEYGADPESRKLPLKTVTNINAARRHDDHDPHFAMKNTDSPSGPKENLEPEKPKSNTNAAFKPRSDMSSNWNFADIDERDEAAVKKIYKTAGDGMGGRANTRFWDVAGDDAPEHYGGKGGEKQVYKTAGNGMGGKKGTGLSWSIGDHDAE